MGGSKNWIVAVLNPKDVKNRFSQSLAGIEDIGMFQRTDAQSGDPDAPYTMKKNRLGSKQHEGIGLTVEQWEKALEFTREYSEAVNKPTQASARHMRGMRSADGGTGLLMLYLLDHDGDHVEGDLPPVGYAVSIPPLSGDTKISYQVNRDWVQREFNYEEEEEDEND